VRIDAKKIEKARQQKFALRRHESFSESQQAPEPFLDENDLEVYIFPFPVLIYTTQSPPTLQEIRLYTSGLESATKAAKTIILFLMQRLAYPRTKFDQPA
jgi:cohesin loading factor subunit SCC2